MNDEPTNVDPAAETPAPETAPEAPSEETPAPAEGEEPASTTPEDAPADAPASDEHGTDAPDPNASRTGFAEPGLKTGDPCTCPDGRPGTVHRFDAGLICLPNQG